jgi:pimeloyl-ACP methyl ester carboxylesterase
MDIVLIAGLWLDGSVWESVVTELDGLGHRAVAVSLPGQGDGNRSATLADQVATVIAAVDAAGSRPMVVGHSAASGLAWLAADARAGKVSKVVFIGGFPSADGRPYFDGFPIEDGAMPFPGWKEFEGPDSVDLDDATKKAIESTAIPVPEGVIRGVIHLADERRYEVPAVLICPEFSPAEAREWIDEGHIPELAKTKNLSLVDIDSGHWPMITAPAKLAHILAQAAEQS